MNEEVVRKTLRGENKISLPDLFPQLPNKMNVKRSTLTEIRHYFREVAWSEVEVRCQTTVGLVNCVGE